MARLVCIPTSLVPRHSGRALAQGMFAAGGAQISETGTEVTVTIRCRHRVLSIGGALLKLAMGACLTVVFGGGALGLVSPETMTTPIHILSILGGLFGAWVVISSCLDTFQCFDTLTLHASHGCFRVQRTSVFRDTHRDYPWGEIDGFTEIIGVDELFNRGLAMIFSGRHVWLHPSLPKREAEAAVVALSGCLDRCQRERANPQGGANGRQPFGSETNRTSAAAASRRSP